MNTGESKCPDCDHELCCCPDLTTIYTINNPPTFRTENQTPTAYRLARRPNGEYVLQGAYLWQEGFNKHGHTWRDIPTIELDGHGNEI